MIKIGITERGDAGLDFSWYEESMVKSHLFGTGKPKYDGLILITKELSDEFIDKAMDVNCIVHATITGWSGTDLEPYVPDLDYSFDHFSRLCEIIGSERVVLRIDPILPTEEGVRRALLVYNRFHEDNRVKTRVRISFMDNYPHVKQRFIDKGYPPLPYGFHAPLKLRKEIYNKFHNDEIEVCGEPGFNCAGCVSNKDLKILGIDESLNTTERGYQRRECKCITYKREILKNKGRCKHQCLYCYWK